MRPAKFGGHSSPAGAAGPPRPDKQSRPFCRETSPESLLNGKAVPMHTTPFETEVDSRPSSSAKRGLVMATRTSKGSRRKAHERPDSLSQADTVGKDSTRQIGRRAGTDTTDGGLGTELRGRFSFTRSETSVALLLAEGLSYAEIAERLGVSYHTVHTHVKAIHLKARVPSNGRLLALLRNIEGG